MRSLVALFTICLTTTAVAADRLGDREAMPYWPSQSAGAGSKPKVVEYGTAAKLSAGKVTELPPPGQAGATMSTTVDVAPDPPRVQQANSAAPALFQPDTDRPQVNLTAAVQSRDSTAKPQAASDTSTNTSQAAPHTSAPLTLGSHGDKSSLAKTSPLSAMFTVGGSLSIVLGLFLVIAWALRKTAPRGSLVLPKEVFDILGRAPLGARQQVQLIRCGNKLLLLSITPHGTETLTEVTDPLEVDRIAGICHQANPKSSTAAFRQVFQQLATSTKDPGDTGNLELGGLRRKRYRWEEKHA